MSTSITDERYYHKAQVEIEKSKPEFCLKGFADYTTNISWNSINTYLQYINRFINYSNKNKPEDLTLDDYTGYIKYVQMHTRSALGILYSALKRYSKYLYASKKAESDIMILIDPPKIIDSQEKIAKREKGFLTKKEITKVIKEVTEGIGVKRYDNMVIRDKLIILLFLTTGLRRAALWKLNIDDIEIETKQLVTTEKRGKVRVFYLTDEVINLLSQWIAIRSELIINSKEKALFISRERNRLSYEAIGDMVKKYTACVDNKNISVHKLRATYGTQIYEATKDIYFTQQAMGHSSPATTQLYVRGQQKEIMSKSADIMGKLISKRGD